MNMAKTGRKTFVYEIEHLEDLEEIIKYADFRADVNGLRAHIEFKHDQGLFISVVGPKDKINLFDHQIRDFFQED